jgi:uroporphyrinogen-III synthase
LAQWQRGVIDIVVVNSVESLRNLIELIGDVGRELLRQTQLLVVSERQLPLARQLGLKLTPLVADNATDAAVMEALMAWGKAQKR